MAGAQLATSADGNTLVVGAPFARGPGSEPGTGAPGMGAVYVFTRSGTAWTPGRVVVRAPNGEASEPIPSPATSGDLFGSSVALSADGATLVVGAKNEDGSTTSTALIENNDAPNAGAVYIFVRNGATYEFKTYLKPDPEDGDTAIAGDHFGGAVALAADGQTLVVGAPSAEGVDEGVVRGPSFNDGAAYVFTRDADSWTQRAILGGPHEDGNLFDEFGRHVAVSSDGSTIAVGAPFDDGDARSTFVSPNTNESQAGAAYIFTTTDRVHWALQAQLKAPNAQEDDLFGIAVALSADGNAVAIGATGEDGNATSTLGESNDDLNGAGAVYVFTRTDSSWSPTPAYLKPSSSFELAHFGASLSLTADAKVLAVGGPEDFNAPPSAFVYVRVGNAWLEQARLADTVSSDGFLNALLTADGLTLFVSGDKWEGSTFPSAGRVHVY